MPAPPGGVLPQTAGGDDIMPTGRTVLPQAEDAKALHECIARRGVTRLCFFLDYDGTLAPIVNEPDKAFMHDEARSALRALAQTYTVAIISGRSNDKLRGFLHSEVSDHLYLAGSHGVDIAGPRVASACEAPDPMAMVGSEAIAALAAARQAPDEALSDVPGYLTENNEYCISAHYRMVDPSQHARVRETVRRVLEKVPSLQQKEGKMVLELRPRVAWDKGKAVEWLLRMLRNEQALASDAPPQLLPVYMGDDVADEDAFRAAEAGGGIAIKVAEGNVYSSTTAATWSVSQSQVAPLLRTFLREG